MLANWIGNKLKYDWDRAGLAERLAMLASQASTMTSGIVSISATLATEAKGVWGAAPLNIVV
jgi:hypothetical protein